MSPSWKKRRHDKQAGLRSAGAPVALDSKEIRFRDIWDLAWLLEQGQALDVGLLRKKIMDYSVDGFEGKLSAAIDNLPAIARGQAFNDQMKRFIDTRTIEETLAKPAHVDAMVEKLAEIFLRCQSGLMVPAKPKNQGLVR